VLSIYPELATDDASPLERLARIRRSMNVEKQRSLIEEQFLDLVDSPYGARDRRAACANPELIESVLGPANVVLSNVPGAETPLSFAGYEMVANYPVPIVGPGRFLNITSRRNGDHLHMGVMADSSKVDDLDAFVAALRRSMAELKACAERVAA
jgi:diacylglycerol O-acyltransferase